MQSNQTGDDRINETGTPSALPLLVREFAVYPEILTRDEQDALVSDLSGVVRDAPFYRPEMPRTGKTYSALMTNCGPLGWVSDRHGYRYQDTHPVTGKPWPAMPEMFTCLWQRFTGRDDGPEAALINLYRDKARLGLHVDATEEDLDAPVLSISLGDTAVFRMGGQERNDPTQSVRLASGSVVVMGGHARLAYHGVDRILAGSSTLLERGGRLSVTLRRVGRGGRGANPIDGPEGSMD